MATRREPELGIAVVEAGEVNRDDAVERHLSADVEDAVAVVSPALKGGDDASKCATQVSHVLAGINGLLCSDGIWCCGS